MEQHVPFLRECFRLAQQAKDNGNHPFGSILVHDGQILIRAQNAVNTYNDLAQHPESIIARAAASRYDADFLAQCTLYTSTEPCAMCSGALYWSGIGRIVFSVSVASLASLVTDGLTMTCGEIMARGTHLVEVIGPLLEDEGLCLHHGFWDTSS